MNRIKARRRHLPGGLTSTLGVLLLVGGALLAGAEDPQATNASSPSGTAAPVAPLQNDEIARLTAAIAAQQTTIQAQQKQIDSLQRGLEQQQQLLQKMIAATPAHEGSGDSAAVASLAPAVPARASARVALPAIELPQEAGPARQKTDAGENKNPCEASDDNAVPPYLRLGSTCIIPVGFMDLTAVWRDKAAGTSLGTNFASVPFNNVVAAKNSEYRFTPQNSRIGFRIDGELKGTHFIAYNEFDFLGQSGGLNLTVTNGAFVPRLRLFWIDVRKGKLEFLAGQSWSLLTANRKGLSALPNDLFYSQVVDVNYMAGMTWTRQPGVRILYHPSEKLAMGLSFENPEQYIGGSAGAPQITVPAALSTLPGTQLDNSTNVLTIPNLHPDIIGKVAWDPNSRVHLEVAGLLRTFKIWNPNTNQHFTDVGGGGSFNANFEVVKNLRIVTNNYWSDGGGRYLFGQVPDLVLHTDGSISGIHAGGIVDGAEWTIKNTLLYAYYGGIYAGRNTAIDTNGSHVGYGFTGSSNGHNRTIQEVTFGFNQTLWKNPRYGAFNVMGQYEYLFRNPWYVAPGSPKAAHDNTIYVNIRYSLPGSMPNF
jgi:hypothetical protein